ncbi:MAG: hypothetical protein J6Q85_07905 [Clostridia bacterium]|nr:hypothetical protein [Clostridia bacterium]
MGKKHTIGIDVGTTGTKALLFTEDGEVIAHAYRSYPLSNPCVGYSEQNAEDWWRAIVETVREITDGHDVSDKVAAISLSTQGGTLVPTDKMGNALRPAIVWNDARCTEIREKYLCEVGDADTMYQKTGWRLGRALLALEIRWLRENEPETFKNAEMFLSVPDYVSLKMTGIAAIDLSNAGINQTANIRELRYDSELLRFAGISEEQLPRLVKSGDVIGNLTEDAARELGLSTKTVLVAGAHDQYAVALGAGASRDGDILIGSGTCWVVTAIGSSPDFESGLAQSVAAVPGLWGSLMSLSTGGVCLEWLRKNVAKGSSDELIDFGTLDREADKSRAAEEGLFFFPFTGKCGEKARLSRASFVGMDLSHDRFNLAKAVMEGVAFQIYWMMHSFKAKPRKDGIILAGGASKSEVWSRIVADVTALPVKIPKIADLACVGAAILAGYGAGLYTDMSDGHRRFAVGESVVYPDPERAKMYSLAYENYKKHAEALGMIYKK